MIFFNPYAIVSRSYQLVQQTIRNDDTNQFASSINFNYIATSFTSSTTYDVRKVEIYLAKTGSPVSVISQKIYSSGTDGLPNTLLYTSTTKLSASAVTTISPITSSYMFDYSEGSNLTSASVYHIAMYVSSNTTGSFPSAALLVGIAYNDTPGQNLTRDNDGITPFTLIYNSTQMGHKLYKYE